MDSEISTPLLEPSKNWRLKGYMSTLKVLDEEEEELLSELAILDSDFAILTEKQQSAKAKRSEKSRQIAKVKKLREGVYEMVAQLGKKDIT